MVSVAVGGDGHRGCVFCHLKPGCNLRGACGHLRSYSLQPKFGSVCQDCRSNREVARVCIEAQLHGIFGGIVRLFQITKPLIGIRHLRCCRLKQYEMAASTTWDAAFQCRCSRRQDIVQRILRIGSFDHGLLIVSLGPRCCVAKVFTNRIFISRQSHRIVIIHWECLSNPAAVLHLRGSHRGETEKI